MEGLKVVDFTTMMAGPYATRWLADMGAEVIKVESKTGDEIRRRQPLRDGQSAYFAQLNAGKKSVTLDLKDPADLSAAKALIADCDVLVENFRPGVMARLGLAYDDVKASNPALIYCSISGYGQQGPKSHRPAYAQVIQATSGYEATFASYQNSDRPANCAIFIADVMGALFGMNAIMAALIHRNATGIGQFIDVTLIEGMLNLLPFEVQAAQFAESNKRNTYPPFRTRDGFVMIAAVVPKSFEALLDATMDFDWRQHPEFQSDQDRQNNWASVMEHIEQWTSVRSSEECEDAIGAAGVPIAAYRSVREVMSDPQLAFRQSFSRVSDGAGDMLVPKLPFTMSACRLEVGEKVPALGEHNDEVLAR